MTDIPAIRRRRDGSIDTASYLRVGLCRRSETAHEMVGKGAERSRQMLAALAAYVRSLRVSAAAADAQPSRDRKL